MFGNKGNNKDKMHPEDMRNMLIFFVIAAVIYMAYDALIIRPQAEAIKKAKVIEAQHQATQESLPEAIIKPRADVLASGPRIQVDNGEIYGSISLVGGRIDDMALSKFYEELDKKDNVVLLSPKDTNFPRYVEYGWISSDPKIKLPNEETLWQVEGNNKLTKDNPVRLVWDNGQGLRFERIFSIDDLYVLTIDQKVTNNSPQKVELHSYGLATQTGLPPHYQGLWISHEGPIGYVGDKLVESKYRELIKEPSQSAQGKGGWMGITDKYWLTAFIPDQNEDITYRINRTGGPIEKKTKNDKGMPKDPGRYQVDFAGPSLVVEPGATVQSQSHLFVGAKQVLNLQNYRKTLDVKNFDLAVDFGWFWFMTKPFFYVLHFFYKHIGNMGIAIILLTVAIRTAVFPLTNVSYRSFAKMKKVSPQVLELRKSTAGDKAKLQTELVKLYEREGVNPMAGCLPMILQIPIFFSLYKVLVVTIEMRHAPFFGWIKDLSAADPTNIFNLFGLIAWEPPVFLHIGVFPLCLMLLMFVQKQLNPPPQDPLQRDMAIYMPIMLTYVMAKFAAGLVVYWTFSALIGVIQQIILMRSLDVPIHLFGESEQEKELEKEIDKGPAVHPLAQMAEEAVLGEDSALLKPVTPPKPRRKKKK